MPIWLGNLGSVLCNVPVKRFITMCRHVPLKSVLSRHVLSKVSSFIDPVLDHSVSGSGHVAHTGWLPNDISVGLDIFTGRTHVPNTDTWMWTACVQQCPNNNNKKTIIIIYCGSQGSRHMGPIGCRTRTGARQTHRFGHRGHERNGVPVSPTVYGIPKGGIRSPSWAHLTLSNTSWSSFCLTSNLELIIIMVIIIMIFLSFLQCNILIIFALSHVDNCATLIRATLRLDDIRTG